MALSKLLSLPHLKLLSKPSSSSSSSFISLSLPLRALSFATPEEAAAERRRRKRRLRIEPPLNSLRPQSHHQQQQTHTPKNPNAPKLPEPVAALSGNRLTLHNKILTLIRQNDLDEAALLTRHSVYSNCKPTVFTCNAVMSALLRQSRYSDLLSLHRFITQAGIPPNVLTHNLLLSAFLDCRKTDTALEHYKQLINDAPFNPSPTTYRILIKGLVDNNKLDKAIELKDEMLAKGLDADPLVYHYLMLGQAGVNNGEGIFSLFDELKEKAPGGVVSDGVVCGDLMKGYFLKGMEKEAMEVYYEAIGEGPEGSSRYRMSAVAYNSVLDALSKNGRFEDEAVRLFERMVEEHDPPRRLSVNLGSFNVMVDGYCAVGRFKEAIEVFNWMWERRCRPDTLSCNNLIGQLCGNGMLGEAEEVYKGMGKKGVSPDEFTFGLLMDSCFRDGRPDDAAGYFKTMVESKLRPNLAVYNRLIEGLVKVGKVDEAKSFYELMVGKLKMDDASYELVMKALFDVGKADEVLAMVGGLLRDEGLEFSAELQEFVKGELGKEGREEDLVKLMEDVEREKAEALAKEAEAAEKAKASARAAVSSLMPSKWFGNKEEEEKAEEEESVAETTSATDDSVDAVRTEEATVGENRSEVTSEQVSAS